MINQKAARKRVLSQRLVLLLKVHTFPTINHATENAPMIIPEKMAIGKRIAAAPLESEMRTMPSRHAARASTTDAIVNIKFGENM